MEGARGRESERKKGARRKVVIAGSKRILPLPVPSTCDRGRFVKKSKNIYRLSQVPRHYSSDILGTNAADLKISRDRIIAPYLSIVSSDPAFLGSLDQSSSVSLVPSFARSLRLVILEKKTSP